MTQKTTTIYFIETQSRDKREILCRWVERLYEQGKKVRVAADSTLAAQHLDQLLWTFSETSFVPHRIAPSHELDAISHGADRPPNRATPIIEPVIITIGEAPTRDPEEALVCDAPMRLEYMERFPVAIHFIVMDDQEMKQASRLLWQSAKDAGFRMQHVRQGSNAPEKNL
jgi:DNA polymerase-3 subunit chi